MEVNRYMTFPVIDRYSQMVRSIVGGPFYESLGVVVPLRSGTTPLRLETTEPNTEFGIYINDNFSGIAKSNSGGSVTFSRKIPQGEVIISCRSNQTGRVYKAYLTVRDWAIWLAAYAYCLEIIDDNISQVRSNISINTANATSLQEIYGEPLSFYRDTGQGVDSYRDQVYQLRASYRNFGGVYKGLNEAVAVITQVEPMSYSRKFWGPNWVLDQSMLVNHRFLDRSSVLTSTGNITGVTLVKADPDVLSSPSVPHSLTYNPSTGNLEWSPDGGVGQTVYAGDGEVFLAGPLKFSNVTITGRDVSTYSYSIVSGVDKTLYLDLNSRGVISIDIPSGTPSVATVVSAINTALSSDIRYGAPYTTTASVYGGRLLLRATNSIKVESGQYNAASELLGVDGGDLYLGTSSLFNNAVQVLEINGGAKGYIHDVNEARVRYIYNSTFDVFEFYGKASVSASFGGMYTVSESGYYAITDADGHVINVYVDVDLLVQTALAEETISVSFHKLVENTVRSQGLLVSVNRELLPSTTQVDTVIVYDDITDGYVETPDYWRVSPITGTSSSEFYPSFILTDKHDSYDVTPAFAYRFTDSAATSVTLSGRSLQSSAIDSSVRIPDGVLGVPGGIADYEGYDLKISGWFLSLNSGTLEATLRVSFDGGSSWIAGTPSVVNTDTGGLFAADFTYIEFVTPIQPCTGDVLVSVLFEKLTGNIDVITDCVNAQVKYISSGFLGNATVPRSLHSQYMEDLTFVWSKDPLSLNEKKYLGLPHKIVNKTTPYAGVSITHVSLDTPAGNGTMEYEYTSLSTIKKLRWTPYGTVWGSGVGYVTVTADGVYTLTAPDGSYLQVNCTYNILPTDSRSRVLVISDETTYRGQTREISPCYTSLSIHDVSEYGTGGLCKNLIGVIGEDDFSLCGLVNCDISPRDPFKYAFVYPEFESPVRGEQLTFSLVGLSYEATLSYYSNSDQVEATLYENGIPVPNTWWSFSAGNTVSIPASVITAGHLSISSSYTIDYHLIYQVTSTVLDMPIVNASWHDYAWWVDYSIYERYDSVQGEFDATSQLFFNQDTGRAVLDKRSAANKSRSNLLLQQAEIQREIPKSYWRFVDDTTVEIDLNYLVNGQYFLQHQESRVYEQSRLNITFEHRSGATAVDCVSAAWSTVSKNSIVDIYQTTPHGYHQLRLSISGIRDLRDFKMRSMSIKGLSMSGGVSAIPGLTSTTTWIGS